MHTGRQLLPVRNGESRYPKAPEFVGRKWNLHPELHSRVFNPNKVDGNQNFILATISRSFSHLNYNLSERGRSYDSTWPLFVLARRMAGSVKLHCGAGACGLDREWAAKT